MFLTDFKKSLVKRIIDGFFISAKELVRVEKLMSMSFVFFRFDSLIFEIECYANPLTAKMSRLFS